MRSEKDYLFFFSYIGIYKRLNRTYCLDIPGHCYSGLTPVYTRK